MAKHSNANCMLWQGACYQGQYQEALTLHEGHAQGVQWPPICEARELKDVKLPAVNLHHNVQLQMPRNSVYSQYQHTCATLLDRHAAATLKLWMLVNAYWRGETWGR